MGRVCAICGPLLADAVAGRQWLKSLEEVEPPTHLLHNILALDQRQFRVRGCALPHPSAAQPVRRARQRWWDSFVTPTATFVRQPRFVMSFGMIFFSFSLL